MRPYFPLIGLLLASLLAGCPDAPVAEGDVPGHCSDDADNDRDGAFDCADDGCALAEVCVEVPEPTPSPPGETPFAQLGADTVLIEEDPCLDSVGASDDRTALDIAIACPLTTEFGPGSVLVGEQSGGYMVRVESVLDEGDRVLLTTTPAPLAEAFEVLRAAGSFEDTSRWVETFEETIPIVGPVDLTARGAINMQPIYTFAIDYDLGGLNTFMAQVEAAIAASMELEVAVGAAWSGQGEYRLPFSVTGRIVVPLGPIPLLVGIEVGATLSWEVDADAGGSVTVGADAQGDVLMRVEYNAISDEFVPRWESDIAMSVREPEIEELAAKIEVNVDLLLDVTFSLYGIDGPWMGFGPYADGCVHIVVDEEGPLIGWEYGYGITAKGGVDLDLLGGLIDIDETVEFPGMPRELGSDGGSWRPVGGGQ